MIEIITLKGRNLQSKQYEYLKNTAKSLGSDVAVLYRYDESVLPLIDVFERNHIPYNSKPIALDFFTQDIVKDVTMIILFAEDFTDVNLFMRIYDKLHLGISEGQALKACAISRKRDISIFSAFRRMRGISPSTKKELQAIETHLTNIRDDSAQNTIYRIWHFMGYGEYLEKSNRSTFDLQILHSLANQEKDGISLVLRLNELPTLMEEHQNRYEDSITFSSIQAAKGQRFRHVFLLDIKDGIFPRNVLDFMPSETELEEYEKERDLFYEGVSSAKEQLSIFSFGSSTFQTELLRKIKRETMQTSQQTIFD